MSPVSSAVYFPGLNGLRAIAALIVIVFHADQFSRLFKLNKIGFHQTGMAGYAVDLFFVLSGFLITYLLMVEKQKNGFLDLKAFYLRRILRIWPVYYLAIVVAIVLVVSNVAPSNTDDAGSFSLYVFFLANITYVFNNAVDCIAHLWSVSVEEQFYVFWPILMMFTVRYLRLFILFFFGFLVLKLFVYLTLTPESPVYYLVNLSSFNLMAMGAIGAHLVFTRHFMLTLIFRKEVQILSWVVFIGSVFIKPLHFYSFIDQELNSVFYLVIIINVAANKDTLVSLESRLLNFLGKISYGMYTYHLLVIYILSYILTTHRVSITHLIMYPLVVMITIGVSVLSYLYIELPVRNIKKRFSVVAATDSPS